MKRRWNYVNYLIIATIFVVMGCVPQKKYDALNSQLQDCNTKYADLQKDHEKLLADGKKLRETIGGLEAEKSELQAQYDETSSDLVSMRQRYDELLKAKETLKSGSEAEIRKILAELQITQDSLQFREDRLRTLENELKVKEARMNELQRVLDEKDASVKALKKSVSDALLNFEGKGLSVDIRNGKVYVSLEEELLFASGKWEVGTAGKDALKKLAKVLEQNPDINVLVEGHTDNVPLTGTGQVKDNWAFSVMRATAIVKILTTSAKLDPKRITAAGRSEYLPVNQANTPEARRKNRRTKIILTPRLDELFKIIESN